MTSTAPNNERSISIGCGSAMAGHRLEPAIALARSGLVDYLAFDCLAERTLALAQLRKLQDPQTGFDERLPQICREFAGFLGSGGKIVGNFAGTNPESALSSVVEHLALAGVERLRIGVVRGDDVLRQVLEHDVELPEMRCRVSELGSSVISAHAYIGAEPIVDLLGSGAAFILGGRIADPALYVGPICHELDIAPDDWTGLANAVLAGHLLECGEHVTGGNFADPPYRVVPALHDLAFPMAVVTRHNVTMTKLAGTGGLLNGMTVKAQLAYEIHDPTRYLTPDCTADFSDVVVSELDSTTVRASGATALGRPEMLKIMVGVDLGWKAVGEWSYGGLGCVTRARLAEEVLRTQFEVYGEDVAEVRFDLHGLNALFEGEVCGVEPTEVRLRVAARCRSRDIAETVGRDFEMATYFGPAGGGGHSRSIVPFIGVTPAFLPRENVPLTTEVIDL